MTEDSSSNGAFVKRCGWVLAAGVFAGFAVGAQAQAVDAKVCDVINHPRDFDGKTVKVTGLIQADFDTFIMHGEACTSVLWLSYPAGTKAKSGPAAVLTIGLASNATATPMTARPPLTLERSKDFDAFDNLLAARAPKLGGMCLACPKSDVMATLVGRVDGTENPGVTRDKAGKVTGVDGFGNMNLYGSRLVITSVVSATAKDLDYSKAPKVEGDNPMGIAGTKDYVALARKSEEGFAKGGETAVAIETALAALGTAGQDAGVTVAFGDVANVPAGEGAKGAKSSPDGLLMTIQMDVDKLKGSAESYAIAHEASEVQQLRDKGPTDGVVIESKAWQTVLYVMLGIRQKSITLPGGLVFWSDGWPAPERNTRSNAALEQYVGDREATPR